MGKYFFTFLCVFTLHFTGFSQGETRQENDRKRYEKEVEEKKAEYIKTVVDGLNVDEFQQHIITQKFHSYYDELTKIYKYDMPNYKKKALANDLSTTHFSDLKGMVTDEVMVKIIEGAKGENQEDDKKKKRKKKKNKNKS